jgi:hypothetical protein
MPFFSNILICMVFSLDPIFISHGVLNFNYYRTIDIGLYLYAAVSRYKYSRSSFDAFFESLKDYITKNIVTLKFLLLILKNYCETTLIDCIFHAFLQG